MYMCTGADVKSYIQEYATDRTLLSCPLQESQAGSTFQIPRVLSPFPFPQLSGSHPCLSGVVTPSPVQTEGKRIPSVPPERSQLPWTQHTEMGYKEERAPVQALLPWLVLPPSCRTCFSLKKKANSAEGKSQRV